MFKHPIYITALCCILMMSVMRWQGAVLKTAESPRAIVDLELANEPQRIQALLGTWNLKDVRLNIQLDFLFIVAYTVFLAMAANGMANQWRFPAMRFLGWLMVRLVFLAGVLDIAENLLMLQTIEQHYSQLSLGLTRSVALTKFGLVGLVLLFLLISIPNLFKKKGFMNQEENPWKTLDARFIYENPWIQLTEYDVINPGGGTGIYGKVHFKNRAIGIMVLDNQGNTYLVGQYRYTIQEYSWEIPEGGGLIDTDPLDNAKRELLEETGLVAQQWEKLGEMHLSNSVSDELAILYLATDLAQFQAEPEETEALQIKKLPFEEAYQMVMNGTIKDSMSVAAILKTKLLFLEGKLK